MSLCQYCSRLASDWLIPDIYDQRADEKPRGKDGLPQHRWTHSSWADLLDAARTCAMCHLIARESKHTPDDPWWKPDRPGVRIQAYSLTRLEVICAEEHRVTNLSFGFDQAEAERAPQDAQKILHARLPGKYAGSLQALNAMKRWISVCRSEHGKCSAWSSSHEGERHMPTRILDVADDAIRLYLPEDSARDEYIALSYCWGAGNPYKTTTSNVTDHLNEISISALPPSLQDAVWLTRRIGFRYLWIDALCIIQDDYDDWLREASKMKAVYSQAFLTISTDMLADTAAPFLDKHRSARHELRVKLPWVRPGDKSIGDQAAQEKEDQPEEDNTDPAEGGNLNGLTNTPNPPPPSDFQADHLQLLKDLEQMCRPSSSKEPDNIYVVPTFRTFGDEIKMSPLAKRGWTFQERALSSRILHIGQESNYWECKEACNGEDMSLGQYSQQDSFFNLKDMMLNDGSEGGEAITAVKLHAKWAWVIEEFTQRALTEQRDLFPALDGVTSLFADKNLLGRYFYGLWEDEFLRGLLWASNRNNTSWKHKRCQFYRAPTWSWASACGPIKNSALETAFIRTPDGGIRMLDELGNDGKMGGTGRLTHKLMVLHAIKGGQGRGASGALKRGSASFIATAVLTPVKRMRIGDLARGFYVITSSSGDGIGVANWDDDDDQPTGADPDFWLCPVYQVRNIVDGWPRSDCLVLRKADDFPEGMFERVAWTRVRNNWIEGTVKKKISVI